MSDYQQNMALWAAHYYEKSVNAYYQREADRAQAHFNFAIDVLSTQATTEWGLSVDSADIMSWVDYGANAPYMKGGNLNITLIKPDQNEDTRLTALRNNINQDSRSPGIYSLHLHEAQDNKPAYFHVDTFSGTIKTPGYFFCMVYVMYSLELCFIIH